MLRDAIVEMEKMLGRLLDDVETWMFDKLPHSSLLYFR